ncbi:MAG TPA: DUF3105 domain-containing protein [Actinophytocola sp.]|uniref:DUF3105 domain-containing protein n=1 Tax=Actinophytocola sp. TaxID=1872138 RepID=UPI002DDCC5B3|nr:DUF3105 domain-containing protein [Actinophytocola sp.]HEV2778299.1 DUF3105 domain-containing protein [Actinophytocola sp.]
MASGTKSKGASGARGKGGAKGKSARAARGAVAASKPKPWGTILAVIFVLALAGGVFTYAYLQINEKNKWVVSDDNQDPSENIEGVERIKYDSGLHVDKTQRVAYDQSPPFGGPHDGVWADCTGIVYQTAVRTENMVHSLEHGAVWIAYNPDQVKDAELDKLKARVEGQPYLMLSPYPGLDRPISLQSWGHRLKLDRADDTRIDDFIKSLRQNRYQNPEPRGRCDAADPTQFDVSNPPPFVQDPPGPDAVKMDGTGAKNESQAEQNGEVPTAPPSAPSGVPSSGAAPPSS